MRRYLIVTDRDELDKQIEGVIRNAGVIGEGSASPRITSRAEFVQRLEAPLPRLLCALIHKFERGLEGAKPKVYGRFYVFVDECHRTQGGEMHQQMKRWLEHAVFVGFTGTPLLKKDKQTTFEVFGTYIDTYKFQQAVADGVVLDLKYEARTVPQRITSQAQIDAWFASKTKNLNNFQKAALKKRWTTMQDLMSSGERKQRILASIIDDFATKPRLNNDRGTAMLVVASIYDACHYFRLLQNTPLAEQCAIITSFEPNKNAISTAPTQGDERYKFDTYTKYVLQPKQTTKQYEDEMKRRFIEEPANCKLLIVVSKLLTGFDAPSCTYLYLDHELRDHNLFQAICRTNRLDGEDKDYGYIVDFKESFEQVQQSVAVYSSDELETDTDGNDGNVLVKDWLKEGIIQLEKAREHLGYLCEPVPPPKGIEQFQRFFCGDANDPNALGSTEPLRITFYKQVVALLRVYANVAQHLEQAGYTPAQIASLEKEVQFYTEARAAIKRHSGEEFDPTPYDSEMRHLLNTYIQANPSTQLGNLSDLSLTELIVATGIHNAIAQRLNASGKLSNKAVAEGIINNVRKTIIRENLTDPRFYAEISALFEDLILQRHNETLSYEAFLLEAEALAKRMAGQHHATTGVPTVLHGKPAATVLYNNLPTIAKSSFVCPTDEAERAALALELDKTMREKAPADWRNDAARTKQVQNALFSLLQKDRVATEALVDLIAHQGDY